MRIAALALAALVAAFVAPLSGAAAQAGKRLTVVELYTAQGCNSCVAAEALIDTLSRRPDILPLGFHVDYWDFLGWRDPFASPEHAMRQEVYARQAGVSYVFTPHVIVDGVRQASTLDPASIEALLAEAAADVGTPAPTVRVFLPDSQHLGVSIGAADWSGEADVLLVRFDRERTTEIRGGVNAGRTMISRNIVRRVVPLATWSGAAVELRLPMLPLHDITYEFCAVIVQERKQGRILAAGMLDLPAALAALK
ncbi:MAG: DUF1223 domain-containing protein [Alphaproteobacteria bacterium]